MENFARMQCVRALRRPSRRVASARKFYMEIVVLETCHRYARFINGEENGADSKAKEKK